MGNTITLVKDNQTYTFPFTIRASSPSISNISCTLPQPGETVTVKGANLEEVTKVTLPGGVEVTSGIESDPKGEWFTFTMPSGVTEAGCITAEGANGTAISAENFNDNRCFIINFDGLGVQGGWSATYKADDLVDDPLNSGRGKVVKLIPDSRLAEGGVKAGVSNIPGWWTSGNGEATDDWDADVALIEKLRAKVDAMFKTLAASGKFIRVTELDVAMGTSSPSAAQYRTQAETYKMIFQSYLQNVPAAQQSGITIWSLSDNADEHEYWLNGDLPNLFDGQYLRKWAYKGVCDGIAGEDLGLKFGGDDYKAYYEKNNVSPSVSE